MYVDLSVERQKAFSLNCRSEFIYSLFLSSRVHNIDSDMFSSFLTLAWLYRSLCPLVHLSSAFLVIRARAGDSITRSVCRLVRRYAFMIDTIAYPQALSNINEPYSPQINSLIRPGISMEKISISRVMKKKMDPSQIFAEGT